MYTGLDCDPAVAEGLGASDQDAVVPDQHHATKLARRLLERHSLGSHMSPRHKLRKTVVGPLKNACLPVGPSTCARTLECDYLCG